MAALCSGQLPRAQQGVEFAVPLQAEPQLLQNVSQLLKPSTVFHSRIFQTWTFLVWSTNYLAVTCCKDWTFHLVLASYWYYRCEINAPLIQHLLFLLLCNAHIFFFANVYATWIIFGVNIHLYVFIYWIITLSPITLLVRKSWLKLSWPVKFT